MDITFSPDTRRSIGQHIKSRQVLLRGHTGGILGRPPPSFQPAPIPKVDTTNPDFLDLVKTLKAGARLLHAAKNWEHLPLLINRNLDHIASSIKPPMASQQFRQRIDQAFENLKKSIQNSVQQSNDENLLACNTKLL